MRQPDAQSRRAPRGELKPSIGIARAAVAPEARGETRQGSAEGGKGTVALRGRVVNSLTKKRGQHESRPSRARELKRRNRGECSPKICRAPRGRVN